MGWVKYSTVGAKAGDNLKDSGGSVLGDTAVKNAEITLNAAGYLNNIGTTEKFKNALITTKLDGTLNYDGTGAATPSLANIGGIVAKAGGGFGASMASSTGIVRFASGTLNTDTSLATTYTDANNVAIVAGTDGNISVNVNSAGAANIAAYSAAEKVKINNLQAGKTPGNASLSILNSETTFAETTGTKPPADANKVVVVAGTDGNISVDVNGAGAANIAAYSSAEKIKINRLQAGKIPTSDSVLLENTTASQTKVDDRLSSTEKTRLNAGNSPDNSKAFDNTGVTLAATGVLTGGGTSVQVNIGNIAASNFDTAGDLTGDLNLKSALTIPAVAGNKIICGNITIDGQYGRIVITD